MRGSPPGGMVIDGSRTRLVALCAVLLALAGLLLIALAPWTRLPHDADPGRSFTDSPDMVSQLAAHLRRQPRDARGWAIYARLRFERDDYADAAAAFARAVDLPGKVARDPGVWCEYADALAMTQGGKIAGKPRELVGRALALNPRHPRALEMAGSAEIERGEYAGALRYWEPLLEILAPGSEAFRELGRAIERTREQALR